MSTRATDERVGTRPSRVAWLSGVHFLIALMLLAAVPLAVNEVLHATFFSPRRAWLQDGESMGWASSALDEFFLATPYWASYQPGWIIGLLPGLLVASAAWGLRKQRAWGRQLAIGFHAVIAMVALAAIAWAVYGYGAMEWAFLRGDRRVSGPDSLSGVGGVLYALLGATAFGVLVVVGGLLWWLCRPATRSCFPSTGRRNMRTLLACCIGVTAGVLVPEVVYNRMAVYHGEATYQGKSTGHWLTLLASRNTATRQAAVEKLGESVEAAPVLCEMVRDKPSRPDAVRPIFREEVRRISREAGRPLYWSRAWQTPEWKALTDPPRGRQP